jgi:hypothetical protein
MIIKDKAHIKTDFVGDKAIYTQAQDLTPWKEEIIAHKMGQTDGYSKDRTMRHIAKIPEIEFLKHPEWMHDGNLILDWLKSEEGRNCITNKIDTGRSGKIIIK